MSEVIKQEITKEKLQELFRSNNRKINITDEALDLINQAVNDPVFDGFKLMETMVTYQNVLEGSNAPLVDYINAIKFTSFLEANEGNYTDAYIKTFWSRDFIQDRVYASTDSDEYKQITSAANRYRKSKLVTKIITQSEIPFYILFQGYRYKALNRLVYEMEHAHLPKDRINAADKVLQHTAPPEEMKLQLDLGVKDNENNIVAQYEKAMQRLATEQRLAIKNSANADEVVNVKLVEAEIVDES